VTGSSYRRPGARMLFTGTRWLCGSISGGCLERDLMARGPWLARNGSAALVRYDSSSADEGPGAGCGGVVDVLVERLPERKDGTRVHPLEFIERCLDAQLRGVLVTVFASRRPDVQPGACLSLCTRGRLASSIDDAALAREMRSLAFSALERGEGATSVSRDGCVDVLIELIAPPPHLFVFGSGHDVPPLLGFAKALGWNLTSCDRVVRFGTRVRRAPPPERRVANPSELVPEIDACVRALAVVMSHDYEFDREALRALLASRACYIGMLGPRQRTACMLDDLATQGVWPSAADQLRLHVPAGLALGAESPEEIALAIVAEQQAMLTSASVGHLRDRTRIHGHRTSDAATAAPGVSSMSSEAGR
jgi:xanthine dehydrogenase accessory factor